MPDRLSRRGLLSILLGAGSAGVSGCLNRLDLSRDARTPAEDGGRAPLSSLVPALNWRVETDGEVVASPAVTDGALYCGSHDGHMYAFEGAEGSGGAGHYPMFKYDLANTSAPDATGPGDDVVERWRFPTDGRVFGSPAVVEGTVYFGSEDNTVYAVDERSGEREWQVDVGGMIGGGSPTVDDGTVYVSGGSSKVDMLMTPRDSSGTVRALDAETGDERWVSTRDEGVQSPPAVYEGVVYHGCQDANFYALDAATGDEVWRFEGADEKFCGNKAAIADGVVYAGCEDGSLYALDAEDGSLVWEFDGTGEGSLIVSSAAVAEGGVYFGASDGVMYGVDAATGEELWRTDVGGPIASSPAYRDGVLYVGRQGPDGEVLALDRRDGSVVWRYQTDSHVLSSPVVDADDTVYVGSNDRHVYAIESEVAEQ